ncbi:MAG: hypothetical protein ACOYLQ_08885 [Hyphomicrobiaceae bacterium]
MPFFSELVSWHGLLAVLAAAGMAAFIGTSQARAASLDGLAVEVKNQSEPVLCAEKDNVALALSSAEVRSFRIEAGHPVYGGMIQRDSFEPDWTACDMAADPVFTTEVKAPVRKTIYEEPDFWLVGWTLPTFWRPANATIRIGDRVEKGLHLVQLWMIRPMGGEEALVLYPQDGYWRIKPLAPKGLAPTAFGSSFLVGPIEDAGRPIVDIKEIAFDPKTRTFTLAFARGGSATLRLVSVDSNRHAIDVAFDKPIAGRPFAMLRSMYVTEFNNDVARVAVREKGAKGWREAPILSFDSAVATDVWAGRLSPSQHNTSSPDMVLNSFSDGPTPKRPRAEAPPTAVTKP